MSTRFGIDCSTDARYDVVIVDPSRVRKDGEPVTDDLLSTGMVDTPFEVLFANIESLTDVPAVQRELNADLVLMMTGTTIYEASEEASTFTTGMANGVMMGDTSDDAFSKWAVLYWNGTRAGPHEFGHLLGGQHDESQDSSCGDVNFEFNCGFADDATDVSTIMAYVASCDDTCQRELMFSNPHREHPDHPGLIMGATGQYNACTVYQMWEYTSLTSDVYNGYITQATSAVDSSVYLEANCPTL